MLKFICVLLVVLAVANANPYKRAEFVNQFHSQARAHVLQSASASGSASVGVGFFTAFANIGASLSSVQNAFSLIPDATIRASLTAAFNALPAMIVNMSYPGCESVNASANNCCGAPKLFALKNESGCATLETTFDSMLTMSSTETLVSSFCSGTCVTGLKAKFGAYSNRNFSAPGCAAVQGLGAFLDGFCAQNNGKYCVGQMASISAVTMASTPAVGVSVSTESVMASLGGIATSALDVACSPCLKIIGSAMNKIFTVITRIMKSFFVQFTHSIIKSLGPEMEAAFSASIGSMFGASAGASVSGGLGAELLGPLMSVAMPSSPSVHGGMMDAICLKINGEYCVKQLADTAVTAALNSQNFSAICSLGKTAPNPCLKAITKNMNKMMSALHIPMPVSASPSTGGSSVCSASNPCSGSQGCCCAMGAEGICTATNSCPAPGSCIAPAPSRRLLQTSASGSGSASASASASASISPGYLRESFNAAGCSKAKNGTSCFQLAASVFTFNMSIVSSNLPGCGLWMSGNMTDACPASCKTLFTFVQDTVGCCGYGLFKTAISGGMPSNNITARIRFVFQQSMTKCGANIPTTCAASSKKFKVGVTYANVNCTALVADSVATGTMIQKAIDTASTGTGSPSEQWSASVRCGASASTSRRRLLQNNNNENTNMEMEYTGEDDQDVDQTQQTFDQQQSSGSMNFESSAAEVPESAQTGPVSASVTIASSAPSPASSSSSAGTVAASLALLLAALFVSL